jgi:hypothetical protein
MADPVRTLTLAAFAALGCMWAIACGAERFEPPDRAERAKLYVEAAVLACHRAPREKLSVEVRVLCDKLIALPELDDAMESEDVTPPDAGSPVPPTVPAEPSDGGVTLNYAQGNGVRSVGGR